MLNNIFKALEITIRDNKINEFDLIKLGENAVHVEPILNGGIYYLAGRLTGKETTPEYCSIRIVTRILYDTQEIDKSIIEFLIFKKYIINKISEELTLENYIEKFAHLQRLLNELN